MLASKRWFLLVCLVDRNTPLLSLWEPHHYTLILVTFLRAQSGGLSVCQLRASVPRQGHQIDPCVPSWGTCGTSNGWRCGGSPLIFTNSCMMLQFPLCLQTPLCSRVHGAVGSLPRSAPRASMSFFLTQHYGRCCLVCRQEPCGRRYGVLLQRAGH